MINVPSFILTMQTYKEKNRWIATQLPMSNTVEDFWTMVVEQNVKIIIQLEEVNDWVSKLCFCQYFSVETPQAVHNHRDDDILIVLIIFIL